MVLKVAVVGGGIVGVSSAVQIAEHFKDTAKVTIVTADSTPNTTGDLSAGIWTAYFIIGRETPEHKLIEWGRHGFLEWHRLWKTGYALQAGVSMVPMLHLTHKTQTMDEFCKDIVFGKDRMTPAEVAQYSKENSENYQAGSRSVSFACEVTRLLPYLTERFLAANGEIRKQRVNCLREIADEFDIVINCTGLAARHLVNDSTLIPIRGQTMRLDAPWHFTCVVDEAKENQISPNLGSLFVGGTSQYGNYSQELDPVDFTRIRNGAIQINKSLANAKILREKTGLRPGRPNVRLEEETVESKSKRPVRVIHNYGHGGSGVTLAWGCGNEVVSKIVRNVQKNPELNRLVNGSVQLKSKI